MGDDDDDDDDWLKISRQMTSKSTVGGWTGRRDGDNVGAGVGRNVGEADGVWYIDWMEITWVNKNKNNKYTEYILSFINIESVYLEEL